MPLAPPPTEERAAREAARRDVLATLALVLGLLGLLGALGIQRRLGAHPTAEQCGAMFDRYAEQLARAARPDGDRSPEPGRPTAPHPPADIARCTKELTLTELACAMRSGYADELERCLP